MEYNADNWLDFDRYAVYGLGASGRGACRLLASHGKDVLASDTRERESFGGELETVPSDVDCVFGANDPGDAEVVILSPGLEPASEPVVDLRDRDIPFCSEIDLAYDAAEAPILGITGTDGKTTTTTLLGEIADASRYESAVGGNIGTPLSDVVRDVSGAGVVVAEISAFQLWSCRHLRLDVAGYTNIADDHLDYFETRDEYRGAKRQLERGSKPDDWVVYNLDDSTVETWFRQREGRCAVYGNGALSRVDEGAAGVGVERRDGAVVASRGGETTSLFDVAAFALPGTHNLANAMCASAAALAFGCDATAVGRAMRDAEGLPHRVERVAEVDGVVYVNDSKATNVNAALAGLQTVDHRYVAIVGGVDKGLELGAFCRELAERAAGVVMIGEVADRLESELRPMATQYPVARATTMVDAVKRADQMARAERSETVILSPAASSFDMFESYEDRGERFREAVEQLGRGRGGRESPPSGS